MFTAELAVGLLAVVPLLFALVGVVAAGAVQVKTAEMARTAARLLARRESPEVVRAEVATALPDARLELATESDYVQVVVCQAVGGVGVLPSWPVCSEVRVPRE